MLWLVRASANVLLPQEAVFHPQSLYRLGGGVFLLSFSLSPPGGLNDLLPVKSGKRYEVTALDRQRLKAKKKSARRKTRRNALACDSNGWKEVRNMVDEQGNHWEMCSYCYTLVLLEDITWDEQDNMVCKACCPIFYMG
jgi:hypothetical protein